jgi:dephospho-CoA kinase
MLRVGLTGGIACGKSTVAAIMREFGCHVIDADRLAHEAIEQGRPAYDDVAREFGQSVVAPNGSIDRAALAAIVFADSAHLERLNAIVHPRVREAIAREIARFTGDDPDRIFVVEAALLVESGYYRELDRLIVVLCPPAQQLARLTDPAAGRRMSRTDAERRIAAQMSMEEKRKLATDEIDTSGTLAETRAQVTALVARLRAIATGKK